MGIYNSRQTHTMLRLELVESLPMSYKFLVLLPPAVFAIWFVVQRGFGFNYTIQLPNMPALRYIFLFFQNRAFFENIFYYFLVRPVLNYVYFILLVEIERVMLESIVIEWPVAAVA